MELFGMPVVQVYLYALIIAGLATILYVFFSDVAEGIGEGSPFLNPAVVLSIHNICSSDRLYYGTNNGLEFSGFILTMCTYHCLRT